jgi:hypothetical protein
MLPPEIIDRLRRDHERDDRPALELPLPLPPDISKGEPFDEEEKAAGGVIVIDLA